MPHGELLVAVYVFVEQIGLPIPAVPVLVAAGGLASAGKLDLALAVGLSVAASLAADLIWYVIGRRRGMRVLAWLCRISLEPDSCVRRTESVFVRHGARSLLVSKFIPGLSTVAPPLAGVFRLGAFRFAVYSLIGAALWVGVWIGLGYTVGDVLAPTAERIGHMGTALAAMLLAVIGGYVGVRWVQRRRFLDSLRVARLTPEALKEKLDAGEAVLIVDLRGPLESEAEPATLPSAIRMLPDEIECRHGEIPRDRDVVLYCT